MAELSTTPRSPALLRADSRPLALAGWAGGALVIAALFLWLTEQCRPFTIDDAFISFRYAENLARGAGLVYNPGERVEGYTNFLWVLIIAAVYRLGGESLAWAKGISTAANVVTLLLVAAAAWRWWPRPALPGLALVPPLLLAVNFGVVLWGVGGLETALFACLVTAALLRLVAEVGDAGTSAGTPAPPAPAPRRPGPRLPTVLRPFPGAAGLFALATLARPDGTVLFAGAMLGWVGWALVGRHFSRRLIARWLAGGALYGLIVGSHYLFRYLYYGAWVPNTVYVKVPSDTFLDIHWGALVTWLRPWGLVDPSVLAPLDALFPGLDPWWRSAVSLLATPTVLLVTLGLLAGRRRAWAWVLGVTLTIWLVYLMHVYDDWMPGWRFYVPVVPAVTLLMAAGLDPLAAMIRRRRLVPRGILAGLLAAVVAGLVALSLKEATSELGVVAGHAEIQRHYRAAGEYLRAHAPPGATLAVIDAGAIPYFSGLYTIDYGGLADAHMARVPFRPATLDKGDGQIRHYVLRSDPTYLLDRRPDFVQLGGIIRPDGRYLGHLPELVLVYDAMVQAGTYDLAHPVLYDAPVQLILVRRTAAPWTP